MTDAGSHTPRPSGVVTLLFTDIEGSTRLLGSVSREVSLAAFEQHHRVLRSVFRKHDGYEVRTEGDSFFMVFQEASAAVAAAVDVQRELAAQEWPEGTRVRVRIGLHTGEPTPVEGEYFGLDVHRAARISSAGHGGQVLVSHATRQAAELPPGVRAEDLGEHRLKDLEQPEWLFQLLVDGLEQSFPSINSLETPSNLPVDVTPLVGRDDEVSAVESLLADAAVRLVTITGPGGTGKTRVALAAARRLGGSFRNGLVFVDLAQVSESDEVGAAIERALDLTSAPDRTALENVVSTLRDQAVLLVLDNFEHVAAAAGDVATLLAGTRRVKAIVTSRSALRLGAEREYPLGPLPTAGAVSMFVERARSVKPDFEPSTKAITEICERLDCLPLAIELAAARTRVLSADQILSRLESRLTLLTGGTHDLPARQKTLRDTIAWSYDLLPEEAATLLRRAATFAAGATLEALEFMSYDDPETFENIDVLLSHSLMRQEGDRFVLLSTIREYALEQAAFRGELEVNGERHAAYFAQRAAEADAGMRGAEQGTWRRRLDTEMSDLLAALEWSIESEESRPDLCIPIATALGWHWYMHGRAAEGSEWLRKAYAGTGAAPAASRASLAHRLGILLDARADKAGAAAVLADAVALYREAGDLPGEARALNSLGSAVRQGCGANAEARELFERALQIRTEIGDKAGVSVSTYNLGTLAMDDGDFAEARRLCEASRDLERELEDEWGEAIAVLGIAAASLELGERDSASALLHAAMATFVEAEDEDHMAETLSVFAAEAGAFGHLERSARLAGAADALWTRVNLPLAPADLVQVERHHATARERLGPEAFARAFDEGRAMTTSQAVAYALER